jgi:hypothetical protein
VTNLIGVCVVLSGHMPSLNEIVCVIQNRMLYFHIFPGRGLSDDYVCFQRWLYLSLAVKTIPK